MVKTEFKFDWPDQSKLSLGAFAIVKKLRKAGFEAYLAGGAVRDALLKRPIREVDIATSATPQQVKKLFAKTIPTGEKHGTITVYPHLLFPLARGRKQRGYEVTTFRVEGPYKDYRRPAKVKFLKTAEEDAKRRDFTINALFYDPKRMMVIDYVDGIADLVHKKIRLVGDSEARIKEDALRMLRAVRFATTLEFDLVKEARKAIQENARLITKISAERIKQELDQIILSWRAAIGLGLLDVVELLGYILPELKNCQGVKQPKNQHAEGDVYTHSLLALEKVDKTYDLAVRYAVLFHDLGKPKTYELKGAKITFYNHTKVGAEMVAKICQRLKFSSADSERIAWLVQNHLVPNDFRGMRLGTRRKWGLHPYFPDLLKVYAADVRASLHPSGRADQNPVGYREGLAILKEIQAKPLLKKPLLSGYEVMKMLKIKEGPAVGKVLKIIEDLKLAGKIKNKSEAKKLLKENKKLLDKNLSTH